MYADTALDVKARLRFRISTYNAETRHTSDMNVMCAETGEDAFDKMQSLKRLIADGINAVIEHKTDSICVPLPKSTHVYAHIHGGRTVWRNDEACAAMRITRDADTDTVRIAMEAEDDMLRHVAISLDENDLDELRHDLR